MQLNQPEVPATSAALCRTISMTAALRRDSDRCCILLRCSFSSLNREIHNDQYKLYKPFLLKALQHEDSDKTKGN